MSTLYFYLIVLFVFFIGYATGRQDSTVSNRRIAKKSNKWYPRLYRNRREYEQDL